MKCTECKKNEATVYYREVINGKETEYALCPECAAKHESKMNKSFFDDFYSPFENSLIGSLFSPAPTKLQRSEKKCTLCGSTIREIAKSGKVGCPVCYSVFREELSPTLTKLHGNGVHRGRVPKKLRHETEEKKKLEKLNEELKTAIAEEKYEDAAVIRDKIREIRGA